MLRLRKAGAASLGAWATRALGHDPIHDLPAIDLTLATGMFGRRTSGTICRHSSSVRSFG